ncbi:MAG: phosphohydrolase [Desulfuromonadales bacterium C00003068]|jgi:HD superfamily phosphodiesterase|nr:MAG: phosphohydrolase [Desulfuromonadales bacterium C00003068]
MKNEQIKGRLIKAMVDFFEHDYRRINHAIEVLKYAEQTAENTPEADEEIVIGSAILHDVGIKPSEAELGYNNGKTQEQYGPAIAIALLEENDFPAEKIEKVAQIIGNHHSSSRYDYVELEILKIADRIVNKLDAAQQG